MPKPNDNLPPDHLHAFAMAWVFRQPKADGEPWTIPELAKHLGVRRETVWRLFNARTSYSRHDYLPQIGAFIGKTPMEIYSAALARWRRDPDGLTLEAERD